MGVRGLFHSLQSIRRPGKLLPQKGLRIGIDAFCLLYLFKEKQDKFLEYIDNLLLLEYNLTFIMDKRASKEKENLTLQLERLQQKAWQLSSEHIEWFLSMIVSKGISLQWAKEEADPLLARGPFDCVISSDSDMLILGCSCLLVPKQSKSNSIEHDVYLSLIHI